MPHELSPEESEYLRKLLRKRHDELLHELHHAATREFKDGLRREIELTEALERRLGGVV